MSKPNSNVINLELIHSRKSWDETITSAYQLLFRLKNEKSEEEKLFGILRFIKYVCGVKTILLSARQFFELEKISKSKINTNKLIITNDPILIQICEIIKYETQYEIEVREKELKKLLVQIRNRQNFQKELEEEIKNKNDNWDFLNRTIDLELPFSSKELRNITLKNAEKLLSKIEELKSDLEKNLPEIKKLALELIKL